MKSDCFFERDVQGSAAPLQASSHLTGQPSWCNGGSPSSAQEPIWFPIRQRDDEGGVPTVGLHRLPWWWFYGRFGRRVGLTHESADARRCPANDPSAGPVTALTGRVGNGFRVCANSPRVPGTLPASACHPLNRLRQGGMAMTIVETTCPVTAGVDTHADVHVVAVVDRVGGAATRQLQRVDVAAHHLGAPAPGGTWTASTAPPSEGLSAVWCDVSAPRRCPRTSSIQPSPAIAVGKPQVVMASRATCLISAAVSPASSALRAFDLTAPSASDPTASATLTSRCVRASKGPACSVSRPSASRALATSGWASRKAM